jgi:hypothetical protein
MKILEKHNLSKLMWETIENLIRLLNIKEIKSLL